MDSAHPAGLRFLGWSFERQSHPGYGTAHRPRRNHPGGALAGLHAAQHPLRLAGSTHAARPGPVRLHVRHHPHARIRGAGLRVELAVNPGGHPRKALHPDGGALFPAVASPGDHLVQILDETVGQELDEAAPPDLPGRAAGGAALRLGEKRRPLPSSRGYRPAARLWPDRDPPAPVPPAAGAEGIENRQEAGALRWAVPSKPCLSEA